MNRVSMAVGLGGRLWRVSLSLVPTLGSVQRYCGEPLKKMMVCPLRKGDAPPHLLLQANSPHVLAKTMDAPGFWVLIIRCSFVLYWVGLSYMIDVFFFMMPLHIKTVYPCCSHHKRLCTWMFVPSIRLTFV